MRINCEQYDTLHRGTLVTTGDPAERKVMQQKMISRALVEG
jgi:hypothetical protein